VTAKARKRRTKSPLTIREAAAWSGVSVDTIRRHIRREQTARGTGLRHKRTNGEHGPTYLVKANDLVAAGFTRGKPRVLTDTSSEAQSHDGAIDLLLKQQVADARRITDLHRKIGDGEVRAVHHDLRITDLEQRLRKQADSLNAVSERLGRLIAETHRQPAPRRRWWKRGWWRRSTTPPAVASSTDPLNRDLWQAFADALAGRKVRR
jgi:hypothetical protein